MDLYSIIPGIQPTQQQLLEGELMAVQILQAAYPDLDLRIGTGLRDTLIRPAGLVCATVKLASDYYFSQAAISNITDNSDPNLVNTILSNWFVTRNTGSPAVISARLYFAIQKPVTISTNTFFSPDNVNLYYPSSNLSYTASALTYDSSSSEWYIDVQLTAAAEGTQYNISSGSLLYFSSFDPYFLRAEINYLASISQASESNTQFVTRAGNSISTRNLINNPSILANLGATFNYLNQIQPIGFGDPEMVRDQIMAVSNPSAPVLLTALVSTGTTATATLANHGYYSGQQVAIVGCNPSGYNGTYTITVLSNTQFTFTLASSQGVVINLPTVTAVNNPVQIHNGGKVDVYCGNSIASAVVQVETDPFGNVHLTGPIFSFSRSPISGGASADTIPLDNISSVSSIVFTGNLITATTSVPHNFSVGDYVTVTGATQNQTISSITCSGLTVTATVNNHGFQVGNTVAISGVTPTGYNGQFTITGTTINTFTYVVPANITSSGSGTMIASVNLVNGTFPILTVGSSTFTYNAIQSSTFAVLGTITATAPIDFTWFNTYNQTKTVTSITGSGNTITVTLPLHGYTLGRSVQISNSTVSAFNGVWVITDIINQGQFSITTPTTVSGTSTAGTITNVQPQYDYGFSQSQDITVEMGSSNANGTVSFTINYFQYLDNVQSYLNNAVNRVLCANYLARGFNFYYLTVNIASYETTAPSSVLATQLVQGYLNTLGPGSIFIMSDLVAYLRYNGIINIQNPPVVTYICYTRDLLAPQTGTITDILDPNDRTSIFLLNNVTTSTININTSTGAVL